MVSIIIPTYNDKDVVCDAIDCSLAQTYKNIEIIVIDDGSTDGTGDILQKKYDNRIKYVYKKNEGLSKARNTGINYSRGEYIQFLDADDLIESNKISVQIEQLINTKEVAVSYCDYVRSTIGSNASGYGHRLSPVLQKEDPLDDLILKWETQLSIPPHCFLFDAAFFKEYEVRFDESLPTHEDWDCWMNVFALNPKVFYIDRPLADYRMRNKSMCSNRLKMRKGYLMAINMQMRKHLENTDVVAKLNTKKKEVRYIYRDVGPSMRILDKFHPLVKKIYSKLIPWRIQRILD